MTACATGRGGGGVSFGGNFFKFDVLRSLLRPFLDYSSALSVALGRLDSDSIWHVHTSASNMWFGSLLIRTSRIFLH